MHTCLRAAHCTHKYVQLLVREQENRPWGIRADKSVCQQHKFYNFHPLVSNPFLKRFFSRMGRNSFWSFLSKASESPRLVPHLLLWSPDLIRFYTEVFCASINLGRITKLFLKNLTLNLSWLSQMPSGGSVKNSVISPQRALVYNRNLLYNYSSNQACRLIAKASLRNKNYGFLGTCSNKLENSQ